MCVLRPPGATDVRDDDMSWPTLHESVKFGEDGGRPVRSGDIAFREQKIVCGKHLAPEPVQLRFTWERVGRTPLAAEWNSKTGGRGVRQAARRDGCMGGCIVQLLTRKIHHAPLHLRSLPCSQRFSNLQPFLGVWQCSAVRSF